MGAGASAAAVVASIGSASPDELKLVLGSLSVERQNQLKEALAAMHPLPKLPQIFVSSLSGQKVLGPIQGPIAAGELLNLASSNAESKPVGVIPCLQLGTDVLDRDAIVGADASAGDVSLSLLWLSRVDWLHKKLEKLEEHQKRLDAALRGLEAESLQFEENVSNHAAPVEFRTDMTMKMTMIKADMMDAREKQTLVHQRFLPNARWQELVQSVPELQEGQNAWDNVYGFLTERGDASSNVSLQSLLSCIRSTGRAWTECEVQAMLVVADTDRDGEISRQELDKLCNNLSQRDCWRFCENILGHF